MNASVTTFDSQYTHNDNSLRKKAVVVVVAGAIALLFGVASHYNSGGSPPTTSNLLRRNDIARSSGLLNNRDFLTIVGESIGIKPNQSYFTVQGLHYAQGFKTHDALEVNRKGMYQDCDNINRNKKLATNFRSDFFGNGLIGFFDSCEQVDLVHSFTTKNLYKFTLSSTNKTQLDAVCANKKPLPLSYDDQHDTYWIDFPFECTTTL
mmetsp:Transcript_8667/g.9939  ORF Transcript_8667/g.9939 Transcript_8667/m.9939 type:complete len:207 (-) Transcript_8667:133-753(-)